MIILLYKGPFFCNISRFVIKFIFNIGKNY